MVKSMITARTLSVLPEMLVAESGPRRLDFVCEQAGLPTALPYSVNQEFYIPQLSLLKFVDAAGRELGVRCIGLLAAHMVSVRDYGLWGDYLLSAPTLRASIQRGLRVYYLHSTGDTLEAVSVAGGVELRYRSGVAGMRASENISYIGLGVIESLVKHYAGQSWRPENVTLDFLVQRGQDCIEDALGSRVHFGGKHVGIFIPDHILDLPNSHPEPAREITIADVIHSRRGRTPITHSEKVRALVRVQMLEGMPSLDRVAGVLAIGVRTLQRHLDGEATTFRKIVESVLFERAAELLGEPHISVTQIAMTLGYSSPSHFARAFRQTIGLSPTAFRKAVVHRSRRRFEYTSVRCHNDESVKTVINLQSAIENEWVDL